MLMGGPLSRGPGEPASAEQVDVQMKDGLAGAGADVEDGAVSVLDIAPAGDFSGHQMTAPDDLCVFGLGFFQSDNMLFRNDQDMSGRLGPDVVKGDHVFIFMNFLRGTLASKNSAKQTVWIGHS